MPEAYRCWCGRRCWQFREAMPCSLFRWRSFVVIPGTISQLERDGGGYGSGSIGREVGITPEVVCDQLQAVEPGHLRNRGFALVRRYPVGNQQEQPDNPSDEDPNRNGPNERFTQPMHWIRQRGDEVFDPITIALGMPTRKKAGKIAYSAQPINGSTERKPKMAAGTKPHNKPPKIPLINAMTIQPDSKASGWAQYITMTRKC